MVLNRGYLGYYRVVGGSKPFSKYGGMGEFGLEVNRRAECKGSLQSSSRCLKCRASSDLGF